MPPTAHESRPFFFTAPEIADCPRCGAASPRNEIRPLSRWASNLDHPQKEVVLVGCYICPFCPEGQRWFRLEPPGFEGLRNYTASTVSSILSLVTKHKLSFMGAAAIGRTLLNLPKLADTTVLRWYRDAGEQVDYRSHFERMVEAFSGQLAIDEVYDGDFYVIKATDPINDLELISWIGKGSPTAEDVREVLVALRDAGIWPGLVVTDGSSLYPKVIQEVWPESEHQLCVFHHIMGMNKKLSKVFWSIYNAMPKPKKRPPGRPKKRGRPRLDKLKRDNRKTVLSVRFLIFKRAGVDARGKARISDSERRSLDDAFRLCPDLLVLRRFVESSHELFGPTTTSHELAEQRRQGILRDPEFLSISTLAPSLNTLRDDAHFARLTRYLSFENADKTSNHVERENRDFRKRQRSHYRLRSMESMCALRDLMMVRRDPIDTPQRLRRREPPTAGNRSQEEVIAA